MSVEAAHEAVRAVESGEFTSAARRIMIDAITASLSIVKAHNFQTIENYLTQAEWDALRRQNVGVTDKLALLSARLLCLGVSSPNEKTSVTVVSVMLLASGLHESLFDVPSKRLALLKQWKAVHKSYARKSPTPPHVMSSLPFYPAELKEKNKELYDYAYPDVGPVPCDLDVGALMRLIACVPARQSHSAIKNAPAAAPPQADTVADVMRSIAAAFGGQPRLVLSPFKKPGEASPLRALMDTQPLSEDVAKTPTASETPSSAIRNVTWMAETMSAELKKSIEEKRKRVEETTEEHHPKAAPNNDGTPTKQRSQSYSSGQLATPKRHADGGGETPSAKHAKKIRTAAPKAAPNASTNEGGDVETPPPAVHNRSKGKYEEGQDGEGDGDADGGADNAAENVGEAQRGRRFGCEKRTREARKAVPHIRQGWNGFREVRGSVRAQTAHIGGQAQLE